MPAVAVALGSVLSCPLPEAPVLGRSESESESDIACGGLGVQCGIGFILAASTPFGVILSDQSPCQIIVGSVFCPCQSCVCWGD